MENSEQAMIRPNPDRNMNMPQRAQGCGASFSTTQFPFYNSGRKTISNPCMGRRRSPDKTISACLQSISVLYTPYRRCPSRIRAKNRKTASKPPRAPPDAAPRTGRCPRSRKRDTARGRRACGRSPGASRRRRRHSRGRCSNRRWRSSASAPRPKRPRDGSSSWHAPRSTKRPSRSIAQPSRSAASSSERSRATPPSRRRKGLRARGARAMRTPPCTGPRRRRSRCCAPQRPTAPRISTNSQRRNAPYAADRAGSSCKRAARKSAATGATPPEGSPRRQPHAGGSPAASSLYGS
jgi:hypothetical protein